MSSTITIPSLYPLANAQTYQITSAIVALATQAQADVNVSQNAFAPPVASVTALSNIAAVSRADGMLCLVTSDASGGTSLWRFSAASSATDATNNVVVAPSSGSGAWLRETGSVALSIPITFSTADATALWTCPTGCRFHVREAWWDVGTSWTGGTNSAIGVDASVTGWSTPGDILGGASGDVAATLVSTNARMTGTIGTKMDTRAHGRLVMIASDTLNFNRITSVFTAGAANVRVLGDLIANAGA